MDEKHICEFCNSSFSTKSNLLAHKKRAKKCLIIQNKQQINELFYCEKCSKSFTSRQNLNEHTQKCSIKIDIMYRDLEKKYDVLKQKLEDKETENKELKQQIEKLQSKLGDIAEIGAKKHTNVYRVNNNIVNQLIPYDLNQEKIAAIVDEKFTENHLYAKENGIANFAVNNLLKNDGQLKMVCTDTSRKTFVYKDREGNLYKDPNANIFLEKYIPAVKKKSYEIISDKDGDEIVELSECIMMIEPSTISSKLANKLLVQYK